MTFQETKRRYAQIRRSRWAGWVFQVMLLITDVLLFISTQSYFLLFIIGVMIGIVFIGFVDNLILDDSMKFNFWQTRLIYQLLTINRKQQKYILERRT